MDVPTFIKAGYMQQKRSSRSPPPLSVESLQTVARRLHFTDDDYKQEVSALCDSMCDMHNQ